MRTKPCALSEPRSPECQKPAVSEAALACASAQYPGTTTTAPLTCYFATITAISSVT
jgi:hypothetical protein